MSNLGSGEVSAGNTASGSWSGFFGDVIGALGEGLSGVAKDVLPVWTAGQLGLQQKDQTSQTTYVPIQTTGVIQNTGLFGGDSLFSIGGFDVTKGHLLILGGGLLAVMLLMRK